MVLQRQPNLSPSFFFFPKHTHTHTHTHRQEIMGNCQAVDNATLIIQHPNGKVDKLFFPVSADEIIKANPGHYVALLLTTTLYSPTSASAAAKSAAAANTKTPLRVTRIKLLRPTDTLLLGHVYRLVTSEEVMKGLWAKKQAKMQQQQQKNGSTTERNSADFEAVIRKKDDVNNNNQERHRSRNNTQVNSATSSKSRAWQPGLKSISESGS